MDAELLLAAVLDVPRARLLTLDEVPADAAARFAAWVDQRADRVPLQHLTGRAPFRHVELAVGPGVFVPRPETELIAGWVLDRIAGLAAPRVVDLGTGAVVEHQQATGRKIQCGERARDLVVSAEGHAAGAKKRRAGGWGCCRHAGNYIRV